MDAQIKKQVIALFAEQGIKFSAYGQETESIHFSAPLRDNDKQNILEHIAPNHFNPYPYRTMHFFEYGTGFYITSSVRGVFRGYRCRREHRDYDAGNIFTYGDDAIDVTQRFIESYHALAYNRRK